MLDRAQIKIAEQVIKEREDYLNEFEPVTPGNRKDNLYRIYIIQPPLKTAILEMIEDYQTELDKSKVSTNFEAEHRGYRIRGNVKGIGWLNEEFHLLMSSVYIPGVDLTDEQILTSINDGNYGVERLEEAKVHITKVWCIIKLGDEKLVDDEIETFFEELLITDKDLLSKAKLGI